MAERTPIETTHGERHESRSTWLSKVYTKKAKSGICTLVAFAGIAASPPPPPPDLLLWPEEQRAFFQDGPGLLLSDAQRANFPGRTTAGRGAFLREFLDRDPLPETPENELRLGIERRRRLALLTGFLSPLDVRSQILFLRGLPAERKRIGCRALRTLEIWEYGPDQSPLIVFRPELAQPYRFWLPEDTQRVLYNPGDLRMPLTEEQLERMEQTARATCPELAEVERAIARVERHGMVVRQPGNLPVPLEDRVRAALRPADLAVWAREAAATPLPPLPGPLDAGIAELDFPRSLGKGQPLAVRALLQVSAPGPRARITLSAVIESRGQVRDVYQALYRLPAGSPGEAVPLLLERHLSPNRPFLLRLWLQDEENGVETLITRSFVAPREPEALPVETFRAALLGEPLLLEDRVGLDSLLLLPPPDRTVPGVWRIEPLVTGNRITRVDFQVDGQVQTSLSRRPFAAKVRLSPGDREQVVRVQGYDEDGLPVAADEVVIQPEQPERSGSRTPFKVDLAAPEPASAGGAVLARARVSVPEGRRIERVEIRLNDVPKATLTAPPWEARIDIPAREPIVYLSAVARLDDGSQTEDVHFLRAPDNLQEVNIRLVELYATVTNRAGRPVANLDAGDFEVWEGGRLQTLARFERVEDLPLNLGLIIDTSGSMLQSIAETQRAASGFLSRIIRPQDRSFVLGVANRPFQLFAPTGNAEAMTKADLPELRAAGKTSLYDGVATAVSLLREGRGQRAIVLLSDGRDTTSHAFFQQVVDFARNGGVTVYAVGLGLLDERIEMDSARGILAQLAAATGGRVYFIARTEQLEEVYGRIGEDLRSRYLLTYQTEHGDEERLRPVEVRVKKRGLKARTARRGYSP